MTNFFHVHNRKNWVMFIMTFLIGAISLQFLPERIPLHFDVSGVPDNYGSRWFIFLAPAFILGINLLGELFRKYDPKSSSYEKFEPQYYTILFAVSLLMAGMQLYTIAYSFGWTVNISRIMPGVMGVLFIFLGNIMPKFKHNYFVGIRTSWTLASEQVWYLTHRFTGKVWVAGGILILFSTFLPLKAIFWVFILIVAVMITVPFIASLYFYKKTT